MLAKDWEKVNTILALGANLPSDWGSPAETLSVAIGRLSERIGGDVEIAPIYVAPAFPIGNGPDFANTVIQFETHMLAGKLLEICHDLEKLVHRKRTNRWAPRTLDIDLIAYGHAIVPDRATFDRWRTLPPDEQGRATPPELILPHPRMQDRAFVLVPMNDIAPNWRHPVLGQTTAEMLAALPETEKSAIRPFKAP